MSDVFQRILRRLLAGLGLALALVFLTGCDIEVTSFEVNTSADGNAAAPGDGVCEMTPGAGDCSLRAAIDEANADPEAITAIAVPPGTYTLDAPGDDDANTAGDLDVAGRVVLVGTDPDVIIDAGGGNRAIDVHGVLMLIRVTVTGGAADVGGGIRVASGVLFAADTTVTGNVATAGGGVGVANGFATLARTTVHGNVAAESGGGVHVAEGATAELRNATVSDNAVDPGAPGVASTSSTTGASEGLEAAGSVTEVEAHDPDPSHGTEGEVLAAPDADGRVPVIVELEVPTQPETDLRPPDVVRQRIRIAQQREALLERPGLELRHNRSYLTLPYVAVDVPAARLTALEQAPGVRAVHPDGLNRPALDDSIPHIGADVAHGAGHRGAGMAVAVIDTGVDTDHVMVQGRVVAEACFARGAVFNSADGDCPDGTPSQVGPGAGTYCPWLYLGCGHGTHVATIAASTLVFAGDTPLIGVAPEADVISVNVFSRLTSSQQCGQGVSECLRAWTSDVLAGLDHVYALRTSLDIAAVNMSLGGGSHAGACDGDVRRPVIENLRAAGIATVAATGNDGTKDAINAPACVSAAIAVGASGSTSDFVASFSNSSQELDLLAPGVGIFAGQPGNQGAVRSGTSMAAPHVAGTVVLAKAAAPWASVDQIQEALASTGVPVADTNGITRPRIRVPEALAALDTGRGGGISSDGTLNLELTTVVGNAAALGGGIHVTGPFSIAGSVVAEQAQGPGCALDGDGSIDSLGWNLDGDGTCALGAVGDLPATAPQLGPLADNGGPTLTHLPAASSPLVDAIPLDTPLLCDGTIRLDQRRSPRPAGAACDIGSVER